MYTNTTTTNVAPEPTESASPPSSPPPAESVPTPSNPIPTETCDSGDECVLGVCAFDSYAPVGNRQTVCCPSGDTVRAGSEYFCTDIIPNGSLCLANGGMVLIGFVQSGICLGNGVCAAERNANGLSCDENDDCQSAICLQPNKTCSASKLPGGSSCVVNEDCLNGVCVFDSYQPSTGTRQLICCPSGESVRLGLEYFCTDIIPNGERCPDELCCCRIARLSFRSVLYVLRIYVACDVCTERNGLFLILFRNVQRCVGFHILVIHYLTHSAYTSSYIS